MDLSVFHFQCWALHKKEWFGLGVCLLFLLQLTLRGFIFNLYLISSFLFFSVLGLLQGTKVFEAVFFGVSVQRLVSMLCFLF